jgi:hypothetical protein
MRRNRVRHFANQNSETADLYRDDKPLLRLPDLRPTKRSVDAWMKMVVYPALVRMKDEMDLDPRIAKVRRYHDSNTKLQPSKMKKDAWDATFRIAKLPKSYYFPST